jgi:aminoglycoside 2'-N-acetyltransferase I
VKNNVDTLDMLVKSGRELSASEYSEILALCTQAYKQDFLPFLKSFQNPVHILGRYHHRLVTHALWVTRWLQVSTSPPMRTAFIEAVATHPDYRSKGFASEIMRRASEEIRDYDIGALSAGSPDFYARFGWRLWRGPLFIRTDKGLIPTPDEHGVMVLILQKTPETNLDAPLSAEWRRGELW